MGERWMTLDAAQAAGVDVTRVLPAIGPRRKGTLYYGAYWSDLNQVLDVRVKITDGGRDERGRSLPATATWWEVTEYAIGESRIRRHCTSWTYDRGNRVHHGPGDLRRLHPQAHTVRWQGCGQADCAQENSHA